MPTYVYGCDTCSHQFDQIQKFQDAPLQVCPQCGARLRRIFQPAGIVFKGSGWYSTDSRAERDSNGNGAKKGEGEGSEGKASGDGAEATPKKEGEVTKTDKTDAPKADATTKPATAPAKTTTKAE